jgi:hypothetical protein
MLPRHATTMARKAATLVTKLASFDKTIADNYSTMGDPTQTDGKVTDLGDFDLILGWFYLDDTRKDEIKRKLSLAVPTLLGCQSILDTT